MQQRTTGLVVGLVSFVIATVALLASTIYFFVEAQRADEKARNANVERQQAFDKQSRTENAFSDLVGFVTGDRTMRPEGGLEMIRTQVGVDDKVADLRTELASLRSELESAKADMDAAKRELAAAQSAAASARKDAEAAQLAAQNASKNVDETLGTYRSSTEKYGAEVRDTVAQITRIQDEMDTRRRNEVAALQAQIEQLGTTTAEQNTRLAELQNALDVSRVKPENAAQLVDGRIIDVGGGDGEVFISLGTADRLQPGMVFNVYDDANSIRYDPETNNLIPGKARIQVLKVSEHTSTARIIPPEGGTRGAPARTVVKDDVIANPLYSPTHRYKFLVHGKFDVDRDGRATAAETEHVRATIRRWGGDVVEGDALRGDLDFVVMGVQPPAPPPLAANADDAAYTQYVEARRAYDAYRDLYQRALESRLPVLNWNSLQVLTNEGR